MSFHTNILSTLPLSHYIRKFKGKLNYVYRFKEKLEAHPDKVFLVFEDQSWTFRDMDRGMIYFSGDTQGYDA